MLNDETIYRAIDEAKGEAVTIWEIAVAAGLRPSDLGDLKRRLRELTHDGGLQRKGKGYLRGDGAAAPGGDGSAPAAQAKGGRRAPWEQVEVEAVPRGRREAREQAAPTPRRGRREPSIIGIVRSKAEGYGFLQRLDGEGEDLFLPPYAIQKVMDGDRVRVRVVPGRYGRDVAEVVEVLEHKRRQLLGRYVTRRRVAWVEPFDPLLPGRIEVPAQRGVRDGQVVKVGIVQYDEEGGLFGEVLGVVADEPSPATEILEIAYRRGFSDVFPGEVAQVAAQVPDRVLAADKKGRRDLTELPLVTIDGPDAQDFDDAVYVEKLPRGGFRLVVAIADVAHYVRQGTPLDEEAFLRGTSLYFPASVLPMLPENISNGICSLQPDVERLCMVADIVFDRTGEPKEAEFYEGVMRSHARCTYEQVAALLGGKKVAVLGKVAPGIQRAGELAQRLRERRVARGALDFDLPEARVVLEEGLPVGVKIQERNDAHRMIEEFMLAANEAVARYFDHHGLPTIYRVHGEPDIEKLEAFARLGAAVGFHLDVEEGIPPAKIGELLRLIEGSPQQKALNMLLLRAMMQAIYTPENIGHYGLAAEHYLHFTAPIRRYPDLVVHRLLKEHWDRGGRVPRGQAVEDMEEELDGVATHSSEQERAAMDAEREADRYLKCLLMEDRVGERFDATVISVTDFGLFTEIDELLIEGLIRAEEIGVRFTFDPDRQVLIFPASGRTFAVGEKVRIEVAGVDVPKRQIHMALVADEEGRVLPPRRGRGPGKAGEMLAASWPTARKEPTRGPRGGPRRGAEAPEPPARPGRGKAGPPPSTGRGKQPAAAAPVRAGRGGRGAAAEPAAPTGSAGSGGRPSRFARAPVVPWEGEAPAPRAGGGGGGGGGPKGRGAEARGAGPSRGGKKAPAPRKQRPGKAERAARKRGG